MSGMEGMVARLHHAFRWDCDNCGRENFERAISMEREYIKGRIKGDIEDDGDYVLYPAMVFCEHCSAQYLASFNGLDYFDDLEEEDE